MVHRLLGLGEKLGDHWIVAILLSSLPESYNPLITALEGRSEEELKLEYVKGNLLGEWRRRCEMETDFNAGHDTALRVTKRQTERYVKRECYYCHGEGHFLRDCPKLAEARQAKEDRLVRENEGTSNSSRGSGRVFSRNVCFIAATSRSKGWLIDSGSIKHMTGEMERLENVRSCKQEVVLADGKKVSAIASGTSEFSGCDENGKKVHVKLKDVCYVPGLAANVISVSRILQEGYTISFGFKLCKIYKACQVILIGEKRGVPTVLPQRNQVGALLWQEENVVLRRSIVKICNMF